MLEKLIPVQALLLPLNDELMDPTIVASKASQVFFAIALNEDLRNPWIKIGAYCKGQCLLEKSVWALTSVTTRC